MELLITLTAVLVAWSPIDRLNDQICYSARACASKVGASSLRTNPQQIMVPEWKKRLREIADQLDWTDALEELAGSLPEDQISETLNQLAMERAGTPGFMLGELLMRRWGASEPAEAARWVAHLPGGRFGQMAFSAVMVHWAEQDLAEAAAWIRKLPESINKTAALFSLASEAATRRESAIAIALVASLPPGPERDNLLSYSVRQWATVDRESAIAWATQIPNLALREELLGKIAIDWGIQDPSRAAGFISDALPDGKARDQAVVNIVRFWAPAAPEQAAMWVEQFPDGPLRQAAMENLIDVWARDDSSAAGSWLSRLPNGRSRDVALSVYVSLLAASSPEQAARWAEAIEDDVIRAKVTADLHDR